jgi:pyrroline-5-carboxylate reductase
MPLKQWVGLSRSEAEDAIATMLLGAVKTMYQSGLSAEQVMDLIPGKPLAEEETQIREIYRSRLQALFQRLKD